MTAHLYGKRIKDFRILEPQWQYTMGQGETRVGRKRIERSDTDNVKQSHSC